ncbi:MAG TPA: hypothetical protein VG603_03150 [Chitinophagales bacterium]|nr:hypothetical protein [Chitinophagales bacterium]
MYKLLTISLALLFTGCPYFAKKKKWEKASVYDLPTTPPIPPESYCFGLSTTSTKGEMHLTIVGDSLSGNMLLTSDTGGNFAASITGATYNNKTLFFTFNYKIGDSTASEAQEWKMKADSLYQMPYSSVSADTFGVLYTCYKDLLQNTPFLKKPCK